MPARARHGLAETRAVEDFLTLAAREPAALILDGEAGIGKTTLWLTAVDAARKRGFRVLSARSNGAESQLGYGAVLDLLHGVSSAFFDKLPKPQRIAVDRALLRADSDALIAEPHATGAAVLSIVEQLAAEGPLLLAIDDLQWVDPSSRAVIDFVTRRLTGPIGVLASVRTEQDIARSTPWLPLPRPEATVRIRLQPLASRALHRVVTGRLGRPFSLEAMRQIEQLSNGNPFFALELARAMNGAPHTDGAPLPATLADLVRARIGEISPDVRHALLAIACLAKPTVELVHTATGFDGAWTVKVLEDAERRGVIEIEGHRLRFSHPLLAAGVYKGADAGERRHMHRRLAQIVPEPELQARHLALASVRADSHTLQALDDAAEIARRRGAPSAAAELIDLAVGLGGDTPERRLVLAGHLLDAGEAARARLVLEESIDRLSSGTLRARTLGLLGIVRLHDDSYAEAAEILERAVSEAGEDRPLRAQCLNSMGYALLNAGELVRAAQTADEAVLQAEQVGEAQLLSQAISFRVMVGFILGDGLDEESLNRALELEHPEAPGAVPFHASTQAAVLHAWTGRVEQASAELQVIRRRSLDLGDENALSFLAFHQVLTHVWLGNLEQAKQVAEDAMEQALQLNSDVPLATARVLRAMVAAYAGRVDEARRDAREALATYHRIGWMSLARWPLFVLAFLELSVGEHQAAIDAIEPLLGSIEQNPNAVEIINAGFVPDAVEAMIALGRFEDAEKLLAPFERSGPRLNRSWVLATAGRCRSMLQAAQGNLESAYETAQRALAAHERLEMPFERARTQLFFGQLQRRRRQKEAAAATLVEATRIFERLGTPLWTARCSAELARVPLGRHPNPGMTESERRVAELAAKGMTNRQVAAALFISPKTVENNLARVYRKLEIGSRAELGRIMSTPLDEHAAEAS
jgi:DNA-binding CsgD family transcriptional regulator